MKWLANISGIIWAKVIGIGTLIAGFFYIKSRLKKVKKLEEEVEDLEHSAKLKERQAEIIRDIDARRIIKDKERKTETKKQLKTIEELKDEKDNDVVADNLIELHKLRDQHKDKD